MCIAYKRTARSQGSAEDGAGPLGKNSKKQEALCKSLTKILFSSAAWLPCDCRERSLTPAQRDLWSKPCYKAPWSCGTNLFQVKGLESSAGSTNPVRLETKFIKPWDRCWLLTQLPKQVKRNLLKTHRSMVWSLSHHPVSQETRQGRCAGVTPENPHLDLGLQRHKNKPKSNTDGSGSSVAYPAVWTYSTEPFLPLECRDTEAVLSTGKKYVIQLFTGSSWSVSTIYLNLCCSAVRLRYSKLKCKQKHR